MITTIKKTSGPVERYKTVEELLVGEGGWAVSWAFEYDDDDNVVDIDKDAWVCQGRMGTANVLITRISICDFVVNTSHSTRDRGC